MPDAIARPRPLSREEAPTVAATEYGRFVDQARSLTEADWSKPTDCPAWDVRAMTGHVSGMMEFASSVRGFVHTLRAGKKAAGDRPLIDGMTESLDAVEFCRVLSGRGTGTGLLSRAVPF